MKLYKILLIVVTGLLLVVLGSCGKGSSTTTPTNNNPNPNDIGGGGDPNEPQPPFRTTNPFVPPAGAYGDIRGIAATREYVYIADANNVYAFDKLGNYRNQVSPGATIHGLAVFPATLAPEIDENNNYFLGNCPIVLHDPIPNWGYCTLYAPGLDPASTREDVTNPDAPRTAALPTPASGIVPPVRQGSCSVICTRTYDIKVDRYGSVIVTADLDAVCTQVTPDWPRILQVMNRFNSFIIAQQGTIPCDPGNPCGTAPSIGFSRYDGFAAGDFEFDGASIPPGDWVSLGTLAVDNIKASPSTNTSYQIYQGAANFQEDYVGVSSIDVDPSGLFPSYNLTPESQNGFGFPRIIGGPSGGAPGSFSPFPNTNDPDLTNGGPSGMAVDPRNDDVYICDPGNQRIQVFDKTGKLKDILTGFVAPSRVAIDLSGNVFIGDVNQLKAIYRTLPDQEFGNIGGTVRNGTLNTPLAGAVVTITDSAGLVQETTVTNINGEYLVKNLPVGDYFLGANKFNYFSDYPEQAIQVQPNITVQANFNLYPLSGSTNGQYVGVVSDSVSHLPVDGATVQIVGTGLTTTTDATGRFVVDDIAPGTYQVIFSASGYATLTKDITILRAQVTSDNHVRLNPL